MFILKSKQYNTKALYFSDKIKSSLDNILEYSMTVIEAPMGYGKTTAVREYVKEKDITVLWQSIYDSSINNFWNGFSMLFKGMDDYNSQNLLRLGFPNDSVSLQQALNFIADIELPVKIVIVIDDYHKIACPDVSGFFEFLVRSEIDNLHIVLATRYMELQSIDELKLKGYVYHMTKETFELMPKEISKYYKLCGISLKDGEAEKLHSFTEGWISAVYLLMLSFLNEGCFSSAANIYKLVEKAVYAPFSQEIKDFLITICIFESFTFEQADYMWQKENTRELLTDIINKNAFIKYDSSSQTYQMHNIFTSFLRDEFEGKEGKEEIYKSAARWYLKTKDYLAAMHYFYLCRDFNNLLVSLEADKGNSIYNEQKEVLIKYMEECPDNIKAKRHFALLQYAMAMFTFNEVQLFDKACNEFIYWLQKDDELSDKLRNRLMGEFELLLSFTEYNNINKMSQHDKKACELLTEPSEFMDTSGSWTFGSPSVLYMFYRESGKLQEQVKDLIEALPYYNKLTKGHGSGAEYVMEAERYFNLGDFENAEITAYRALYKAQANREIGIITCALFLQMRLAILRGELSQVLNLLREMRGNITTAREYIFIHTVDICEAFVYSLLNQKYKIPEWIVVGEFESSRLYFPAAAMMNIVYGRTLLINGEYLKLLGSSEHFIGTASVFSSLLAYIYTNIYLSAANKQVFRDEEAVTVLKQALDIAMPDKVYMPFVENCDYIKPLLEQLHRQDIYRKEIERIFEIYSKYKTGVERILKEYFNIEKPKLTEREKEIAALAAKGYTNKEISDELFISTNTIKTQLKSIFEKLGINSRSLLKQYFQEKN